MAFWKSSIIAAGCRIRRLRSRRARFSGMHPCSARKRRSSSRPRRVDNPKSAGPAQTAVLAGGCFWGVQGVFEHVRGVKNVIAGYAGGERTTAQYETVSSGTTGHAESVKITFDPAEISYGQILQIAFSVVHDPDAIESPRTRCRHSIPLGHFLCR